MKHKFGDGFPSCAVITDEDTPQTIFFKSLMAERILDIREKNHLDLESLCRQGMVEFFAKQEQTKKTNTEYVRKPI